MLKPERDPDRPRRAERTRLERQRPQRPAWPTFRRVIGLHRPHAGVVALLMVVIVASALVGLGPAYLLQRIVDDALPTAAGGGSGSTLNTLILVMVVLVALGAFFGVVQSYLSNVIGQTVMFDLRRDLYRHLTGMSLRWFTSNRTGEVLSRVSNDVGSVQNAVSEALTGIVGNLIIVLSTFGLMLFLDWRLALFSVAFIPLFLFPARRVGNIQRDLLGESQEQLANLNTRMHETLSVSGALLMKTFGRQQMEYDRFEETAREIRRLNIRRAMVGRGFMVAMGLFTSLAPAIVYWYGGHRVLGGEASLGTVVATASLLGRMFQPVNQLMSINLTLISSLALFERIFDYLDLEQEIADRPAAVALTDVRGEVRFEDVTFGYRKDTPVLSGISFTIPPGKFGALVGHSGAGKTTTAYLLPRLYDVDGGRITIDGHDIRDVTLESLTASIAMVNQEPYLFHDTIRANLRYGAPGATDEEIVDACRAANIHDFISGLAYGYDTIVGERGYRLSGGEKQRVSIARALLKDPAILVLDEATSSVDTHTERIIQDALAHLTRGRTVLAIAHRLSTILAADVILVLENGHLVESGTHPELMARGGLYASLYNEQFADRAGAAAAG